MPRAYGCGDVPHIIKLLVEPCVWHNYNSIELTTQDLITLCNVNEWSSSTNGLQLKTTFDYNDKCLL
jgi:hypothetical protein